MTVLGLNKQPEKSDDKEKLVVEKDVSHIMPTRIRLVKARKTKLLTKIVLSISILFIVLIGVFLSVCYLRKTGPFHRKFTGFCTVGQRRWNHNKNIFESYEITDKYALINVPQFNYHHDRYDSVKTLHLFESGITVIQHSGMCFIKKMNPYHRTRLTRSDWYGRLSKMHRYHQHLGSPYKFSYHHYLMKRPALPSNYLADKVHAMAGALCQNRPTYRLMVLFNIHRPMMHKIDPRNHQQKKHVDGTNCNKISCTNICKSNKLGMHHCVKCVCIDPKPNTMVNEESNKVYEAKYPLKDIPIYTHGAKKGSFPEAKTPVIEHPIEEHKGLETPVIEHPIEEHKGLVASEVPNELQIPPIIVESSVKVGHVDGKNAETVGQLDRRRVKRSALKKDCLVIGKFFEGYTPLDASNPMIDYIHDRC